MKRPNGRPAQRFAAAIVLAALAPTAAAAQTPALETGSILIGGQAGLAFQDAGNDDDGTTTFHLSPSVQFFIRPGLAVGGSIALTRSSGGDFTTTSYGIGPVISYYFVQENRAHPFVTGSFRVARTNIETQFADAESDQFGVRIGGGVLFLLTDGVGIDVGLFYDRLSTEAGDTNADLNVFSLAVGVAAFVH